MIKRESYIEIHDIKYFKEDIEKMDKEQLKTFCSFIEKENHLNWIQDIVKEEYKYIIDNILFKL
jgi:hypothetical protein